jgi:hypothetical protein
MTFQTATKRPCLSSPGTPCREHPATKYRCPAGTARSALRW